MRPCAKTSGAILIVLLALLAASCANDASERGAESFEINRSYESSSLAVVLRVSQANITVAQRLEVCLEAIAPKSGNVVLPVPETDFGKFTLVDLDAPDDKELGNGRVLRQVTYFLDPFLAGDYVIPPLRIACENSPDSSLETEEIPIAVASVLPPGETEPALRDIAPLAEITPASRAPFYVVAAICVLLALSYYFRPRRAPLEVTVPEVIKPLAHEIAWRDLERLLAEDLLARGEVNLFHTRLSSILRHYIEGRFGFHAPVHTTEEFLAEIAADPAFERAHKATLQDFLDQCDYVKFAGEKPGLEDIEEAIGSCKSFISETQQAPAEAAEGLV